MGHHVSKWLIVAGWRQGRPRLEQGREYPGELEDGGPKTGDERSLEEVEHNLQIQTAGVFQTLQTCSKLWESIYLLHQLLKALPLLCRRRVSWWSSTPLLLPVWAEIAAAPEVASPWEASRRLEGCLWWESWLAGSGRPGAGFGRGKK